ncbi:hypothetical protein GCM10022223_66410 [Kineosporia mesophila]|uniref:DUF4198 domain-containing protein n=1 Tax=Kineosporia mesophila TaxID=566012 RepID=A0ABP7AQA8_9ACTN
MGAASGKIYVSYGQFHLKGSEYFDPTEWDPNRGNGLIDALKEPGLPAVPGEFAILRTGRRDGYISLTVDVRDDRPEQGDLDEWEDVAEVSVQVEEDDIFGVGTVEEAGDDDRFPTLAEGQYRIRVHARGRQASRASQGDDSIKEEFLLLMWPAEPEPEVVLKTSR